MKRVANMLREHRTLILNWFEARGTISSGIVEGFNNKAKLTTKRAYGFRTYPAIEIVNLATYLSQTLPTVSGDEAFFCSGVKWACPLILLARRLMCRGPRIFTSKQLLRQFPLIFAPHWISAPGEILLQNSGCPTLL